MKYSYINFLKEFNENMNKIEIMHLHFFRINHVIDKTIYKLDNKAKPLNTFLVADGELYLIKIKNQKLYNYYLIKIDLKLENKYKVLKEYEYDMNLNEDDFLQALIIEEDIPNEVISYIEENNYLEIKKKREILNEIPNNLIYPFIDFIDIGLDSIKNLKENDFLDSNKIGIDEFKSILLKNIKKHMKYETEYEKILFNENEIINRLTGTNLYQKGFETIYKQIEYREKYFFSYLEQVLISNNLALPIYNELIEINNISMSIFYIEFTLQEIQETCSKLQQYGYLYC